MPAVSGAFSYLLAPGLRKVFNQEYKDWPEEYSQLFNVLTSKRAYEEEANVAGLGRFYQKPEGTPIAYDDPIMGNKVRYTHVSFGLGFRVSRELYDDDQYDVMRKMSRQLARSARLTVELEAASVFNDAFTGTYYKGFDAVQLCSVSHTTLIGGTVANRPATDVDLGISSLRAMLENRENLKDERGLPVFKRGTLIVTGPAQQWMCKEIIGSSQRPYTSDNEINAFKDLDLKYFIYHYLTDPDAFFLLSPKADHDLKLFWRTQVEFNNGDDFDTKDAKFTGFERFSQGFSDWRGVDGSSGG